MQDKNILHVVNISFVLPYFVGDQFDYFQRKGYSFFVACRPDEFFFDYAREKKLHALPSNVLRSINPLEDVKAILKLKREIKKHNIGVVIGHTPKGAMIGMLAAYLAGVKKRIYFRHGLMYETSSGTKRKLLMFIESLTGKFATKVVCVSPSVLSRSVEDKLNAPSKNLLLNKGTCNGIDVFGRFRRELYTSEEVHALQLKYNITPGDFVVGYVGRLVKDKGIQELLQAWKLIVQQHANVKLLLIGPFEERDSIDEEYRRYVSEEASIVHTGLINDVAPLYGLMDLFILPSYREGFPTVVLEASAMELPVITTRSTGCIDAIIENKTGVFTEINATAIAAGIRFYLENRGTAVLHGKAGRKFVAENFDQQRIWNEIEEKLLKK